MRSSARGRPAGSLPCHALVWLTVVSCGGAPDAQIVAKAPEPVALPEAVERYELGPAQLTVEADVSAAASYTLRFPGVSGELVFAPSAPAASTVKVTVDTRSAQSSLQIVADIARDEFLHVFEHPTAAFTSRAFERTAEALTLFGDFTFHGQTRLVRVPAQLDFDRCTISVGTSFTIDRREFGAVSDGALDGLVSDSVEVRIAARLARHGRPRDCPAE